MATFVNMMNQKFRVPDLSSPDASAADTLPAGYSPPIPIPRKKRYAVRAAKRPSILPPAPYAPAQSAVKTNKMIVETSKEFLLDHLSLVYPKTSWPTTVPTKEMEATLLLAGEFVYSEP